MPTVVYAEARKRMTHAHKVKIETLIDTIECPKDFECYKSRFKNLCKAKDFGLSEFLECLEEEDGTECEFSLPFGDSYFCTCPIRIYIAKKLKK